MADLAGRYELVRELGRGASGRVLLVRDRAADGAELALKLVDAQHEARLRWEFGLLSRIAHPNLARVYELFRVDEAPGDFDIPVGSVALVSELAPGEPADQRARGLREAELLSLALRVALDTARALSAIHAQGLVHGDVKPANIMVGDDGRARLIDLGLATASADSGASAAGTPGFLAPELFRGERTPASDLYALGVTLERLLCGTTSESSVTLKPADLLADALRPPAAREPLPRFVPAAFARLIASLLEPEPASRLSSAREAGARILLVARDHAPFEESSVGGGADDAPTAAECAARLGALPCVGREAELEALTGALAEGALLSVSGPDGAGRSRLIREAIGRLQAARVAAGRAVPTYRVASELPRASLGVATILHISAADEIDAAACAALLTAAAVEGQELTIVLERREPLSGSAASVALGPLGEAQLKALLEHAFPGERVSAALVREALAVSGGLPGRLCRLLVLAGARGVDVTRPSSLRELSGSAGTTPGREGGMLESIASPGRELCEVLAVAGGQLAASAVAAAFDAERLGRAAADIVAQGLATRSGAELSLRPDVASRAWEELGAARRAELAATIVPGALGPRARIFVAAALEQHERAGELSLAELARLRDAGEPELAIALGGRVLACGASLPTATRVQLALALADAERAAGRYRAASERLQPLDEPVARLAHAEVMRLLGDPAAAAALVEGVQSAVADAGSPPAGASDQADASERVPKRVRSTEGQSLPEPTEAAAILARLALDRGEFARARTEVEAALERHPRAPGLRAREVLALSLLYEGDVDRAGVELRRALELARHAGDIYGAAAQFARAFELAERAGELHAAASFLHNVGAQRLDCGEPGPAIAALRESARRLSILGRKADLGRVLYNLAYAAHLVGDDDVAASAVRQAQDAASAASDAATLAFIACLRGEIALRAGDRKTVVQLLGQRGDEQGLPADVGVGAAARRAALALGVGDAGRAAALLNQAATVEGAGDAARMELEIARALLDVERGDIASAETGAERAYSLSQRLGVFDGRLRAALCAARVAQAAGAGQRAVVRLAEVRSLLDAAARGLSSIERARLRGVEAYRAALEAVPTPGVGRASGDQRWRTLAGLAKRFSRERRPSRLYDLVLDAAIELSGAERGVLLLKDRDGRPRVRATRGLSARSLREGEGDDALLSRSIVGRVFGSGRPMTTVDASSDERLSSAASVHALALRSVLAVPLRDATEVRGVLYLEDRLRPFAFGDEELSLLSDLAELALSALDSAELLRAERRAARRLSALRRRLAQRVEAQELELASLKQTAREGGEQFPGIIAHSAAMQRVLRLTAKVARAEVPVLISGESGTGKELIARAVHAIGQRRSGPFVSENCAAIPEPLLESTLFGHVRGAFTGADRRRLGLFEVANGGTLFLDEVGEMPAAMQAKLLRVLQDGEVRPVGGERAHRVDVRVIAATHRDLTQLVAEGRFREDLYYRLAVVSIALPALRQRAEDIAPLVAHFVDKHAQGRRISVDRRALRALAHQPWPGNVRQLENEIRRALVLADDVIGEEHLSIELGDAEEPPDELDLKAQVGKLERRLIRQALEASAGNQTRAARMLGISRYGLQKMIKRLGDDLTVH